MATKRIVLSREWQQISDGSATVLAQGRSGRFAICESATTPDNEQPWHIFSEVLITPPSVAWVKSFSPRQ